MVATPALATMAEALLSCTAVLSPGSLVIGKHDPGGE